MVDYQGNQRASDWLGWPKGVKRVALEPKMDGYRLSIHIDKKGNQHFYCRDPDPVTWTPNLKHISKEISELGLSSCMLDGEVMADDWNETGIIRSGCSGKKYTPPGKAILKRIRQTVKYYPFDLVQYASLKRMKVPGKRGEILVDPRPYIERKTALIELVEEAQPSSIETVNHYVVKQAELDGTSAEYLSDGYEGAMAKLLDSPYVFDKAKFWFKLKPVTTFELQVMEVVEGLGKYVGMMGSLVCKDKKGTIINIGIGWDDDDRVKYWRLRKKLPGRILEAKAQDSDVATARSPVFVRWRPDRGSL